MPIVEQKRTLHAPHLLYIIEFMVKSDSHGSTTDALIPVIKMAFFGDETLSSVARPACSYNLSLTVH